MTTEPAVERKPWVVPTVGRTVHYYKRSINETALQPGEVLMGPYAAIVICVIDPVIGRVGLAVFEIGVSGLFATAPIATMARIAEYSETPTPWCWMYPPAAPTGKAPQR